MMMKMKKNEMLFLFSKENTLKNTIKMKQRSQLNTPPVPQIINKALGEIKRKWIKNEGTRERRTTVPLQSFGSTWWR